MDGLMPYNTSSKDIWGISFEWVVITLDPMAVATSSSLVLNSSGRQLQILCCNRRASRHRAAPSIASIWQSLSPIELAVFIALSYCLYAFCRTRNDRGTRRSRNSCEHFCTQHSQATHANFGFLPIDIAHDSYAFGIAALVTGN